MTTLNAQMNSSHLHLNGSLTTVIRGFFHFIQIEAFYVCILSTASDLYRCGPSVNCRHRAA